MGAPGWRAATLCLRCGLSLLLFWEQCTMSAAGNRNLLTSYAAMPRFIVRVCKTELVLLSADIRVVARTLATARAKVQRRVTRGEEVDDELWFESDSRDTDEPIEITD